MAVRTGLKAFFILQKMNTKEVLERVINICSPYYRLGFVLTDIKVVQRFCIEDCTETLSVIVFYCYKGEVSNFTEHVYSDFDGYSFVRLFKLIETSMKKFAMYPPLILEIEL